MTVYVGTGRNYWQRLIAETTEDLHAFAILAGIPRSQQKNDDPDETPDYYWVTPDQRREASRCGAVYATTTQLGAMLELQRRGHEFGDPITAYARLVEVMKGEKRR